MGLAVISTTTRVVILLNHWALIFTFVESCELTTRSVSKLMIDLLEDDKTMTVISLERSRSRDMISHKMSRDGKSDIYISKEYSLDLALSPH